MLIRIRVLNEQLTGTGLTDHARSLPPTVCPALHIAAAQAVDVAIARGLPILTSQSDPCARSTQMQRSKSCPHRRRPHGSSTTAGQPRRGGTVVARRD
jgi:hypothetical protein